MLPEVSGGLFFTDWWMVGGLFFADWWVVEKKGKSKKNEEKIILDNFLATAGGGSKGLGHQTWL